MENNGVQTLGSNPTGIKGLIAGVLMNFIHSSQYKKVIKKYIFGEVNASEILSMIDIGCGGGKVVNIFSRNAKNSKIYGIDHSSDMVGL